MDLAVLVPLPLPPISQSLPTFLNREKLSCQSGRRAAGSSLRRQRQHVSSRHSALHVCLASDISSPVLTFSCEAEAGGPRRQRRIVQGRANRACVFETAFSGAAQRRGCEHFDQVTCQHNHSRSNPPSLLGIRKNPRSYLRRSCRDPEVSRSTVPVANHPDIRAILVQQQRAMAHACR